MGQHKPIRQNNINKTKYCDDSYCSFGVTVQNPPLPRLSLRLQALASASFFWNLAFRQKFLSRSEPTNPAMGRVSALSATHSPLFSSPAQRVLNRGKKRCIRKQYPAPVRAAGQGRGFAWGVQVQGLAANRFLFHAAGIQAYCDVAGVGIPPSRNIERAAASFKCDDSFFVRPECKSHFHIILVCLRNLDLYAVLCAVCNPAGSCFCPQHIP